MARRFVRALFGPILSGRVESVAAGVMMEGRRVLRGRGDSGQRQRRNNDKRCSHIVPPKISGSAAHPCLLASVNQSVPETRRQRWAALPARLLMENPGWFSKSNWATLRHAAVQYRER